MTHRITSSIVLLWAAAPGVASVGYDFDAATQLAAGATAGQNVGTPVQGLSMLLMKDGKVVYRQAFGQYTVNETALIASTTKTLSAAVLLSLQDSGELKMDDTLSQWLPEYAGSPYAGATLAQAFSHTAGFRGNSTAVASRTLTLRQAAEAIATQPPASVPGTQFAYGGVSMHVAGAAAEVAGGKGWNQLFDERIATPLGMTRTTYPLTTPTNPRIAGGAASGMNDMAAFMEMLRNDGVHAGQQVLSAAAVERMFTPQIKDLTVPEGAFAPFEEYGLGVWLEAVDAQGEPGYAWAAGAFGFASWIDFDNGVTGVFMTEDRYTNVAALQLLIRDAVAAAVSDPLIPGDANRDGGVDLLDFNALAANFGRSGNALWAQGDFTGDGTVDLLDFNRLAANFGRSIDGTVMSTTDIALLIPEPAGLAALGAPALLLARVRR